MNQTILDKIYQASDLYPNRIAFIEEDEVITYKELNERSNQLAHRLIESGVDRDTVVGVCMERNIQLIVTLFGILKAGGAYLPLDLEYPEERLQTIFQNSQIKLLILEKKWDKTIEFEGEIICMNELALNDFLSDNLSRGSTNDLAYVIYTSGSTGTPKGVAIEHAGLYNRINWMQTAYPIDHNDVLFFKTVYTFDVSVWEIFWGAMYGASVVLLPSGKEHDVKYIYRSIQKHQISVIHFVPSVFNLFMEYVEMKNDGLHNRSLKYVFTSGEKLIPNSVNLFNHVFLNQEAVLINLYGPTEASIDVTHYPFLEKKKIYETSPIGFAISNIRLYVLDENMEAVRDGKEGYLYIAGIGLARGYYHNPELTSQKFVEHPFISNERLYNTGDLVIKEKEIIYFVGRKDFQIKLRGLRIELSDIENNINGLPNIWESAVVVSESLGNQFLHAFYRADKKLEEISLRSELQKKIPAYMVPNRFVYLEQFPLSPNGKLDRKKLIELV